MLIKRGYFKAAFNEIWPDRLYLPMSYVADTERASRLNTKNKWILSLTVGKNFRFRAIEN